MTDRDRTRSRDRGPWRASLIANTSVKPSTEDRGTVIVDYQLRVEVRGVRQPGPYSESERACTGALSRLQGVIYSKLTAKDISPELLAELTEHLNELSQDLEERSE